MKRLVFLKKHKKINDIESVIINFVLAKYDKEGIIEFLSRALSLKPDK